MSDAVTAPRSIEDREERIKEIDARVAELDEEYANVRMPDEARDEWNRLNAERDEQVSTVAELRRRHERIRKIAGNPQAMERASVETPAFVRSRSEDIYDLTRIRAEARSEEDHLVKLHDHARRAVERAKFAPPRGVTREQAQTQVEVLLDTVDDERGTLAKRILATGSPVYGRAFGKAVMARSMAGLTGEEQRALSLGVDAEGGFAVPFDLDPTVILTSDGSINPLRQVARVEQIVGKEWQGITSTGIVVTRSPESQEATDNAPTLDQPTVRPERVLGFVPFSAEVDQDWARMRSEMTRLLNDAKEQEEATSFVLGTGVSPQPSGIVTTLAVGSRVPQTGAAGSLTVPDDLHAVEEALGPRFRARASWLANKSIYNLIRANALAAGLTAEDVWVRISSGQPPELIGYPARELSTMDGTIEPNGAGNNLVLLFGDYMTGFLIVDRIGMQVELVPHLFGAANRFPTGRRGIVAMWRNSSVILADNAIRVLNVVSPV